MKYDAFLMLNHNPSTKLCSIRQFNPVDISAPSIPDPIKKPSIFLMIVMRILIRQTPNR